MVSLMSVAFEPLTRSADVNARPCRHLQADGGEVVLGDELFVRGHALAGARSVSLDAEAADLRRADDRAVLREADRLHAWQGLHALDNPAVQRPGARRQSSRDRAHRDAPQARADDRNRHPSSRAHADFGRTARQRSAAGGRRPSARRRARGRRASVRRLCSPTARDCSFSDSDTGTRVPRRAGSMPHKIPVISDTATAKRQRHANPCRCRA